MSREMLIQCPETRTPLRSATEQELVGLRLQQQNGLLFNRLGRKVVVPIETGLVSDAAGSFYCVINEVAWLLAEESIPLAGS
jgi:uncharacterized protein YbaR (Trm112 family)